MKKRLELTDLLKEFVLPSSFKITYRFDESRPESFDFEISNARMSSTITGRKALVELLLASCINIIDCDPLLSLHADAYIEMMRDLIAEQEK